MRYAADSTRGIRLFRRRYEPSWGPDLAPQEVLEEVPMDQTPTPDAAPAPCSCAPTPTNWWWIAAAAAAGYILGRR